jgi:hypothetical protein
MGNPKRTLFTSTRTCPFGCRYCFAKFDHFGSTERLAEFSIETIKEGHIIYPTCDSEFFSDLQAVTVLEELVSSTHSPILVSISVKSPISQTRARFLRSLNERLDFGGHGLIKCSVSLSTKYHVEKYEPRTPSYNLRVQALKALAEEGIPTSVNLKPVLPMIAATEYEEVIDDTAQYVDAYLIGGLYIDPTSEFGLIIKSDYSQLITRRPVNWLPNRPTWDYCEDPLQIGSICRSIRAAKRKAFHTDIDLMAYLSVFYNDRPVRSLTTVHPSSIAPPP